MVRSRPLRRQLFAGMLLTALVCVIASTGWYLREVTERTTREIGAELRAIATTIAANLSGDAHDKVRAATDPDFISLRQQLRLAQVANGLTSEVYTFRPVGDELEFVVMTNSQPYVGDRYPMRAEIKNVLATGVPGQSRVYTDAHGEWISGYGAIRSGTRVVGVVEVDRTAAEVHRAQANVLILAACLAGLLIGLAVLGASWQARRLARPFDQLQRAVLAVEQGQHDLAALLPNSSITEVRRLSDALASMAAAIGERERENAELTERVMAIDRIKDQILSSISHELRTPATTIVAVASILSSNVTIADHEREEFVTMLRKEGDRLARLIEEVLDFVKFGAHADRITLRSAQSRALAQWAVDELAELAGERGIRVAIQSGDWPQVEVDIDRAQRALRCVLDNAIRHTPAGSDVELRWLSRNCGVAVVDHGPGIPCEHHQEIFEPFIQFGDLLTAKPAGIGLGLPIARACMRAQGGDVVLAESTSAGSTFEVRLRQE